MKKIWIFVVLVSMCLPLSAAQSKRYRRHSQQNELKKHNLEVAYELSDYGYREPHMDYPIHITAKKQGVSLVYTRMSVRSEEVSEEDPTFASLELRYMNGKADYDGFLSDGTVYYNNDEKDYYMEAALKAGRYYTLSDSMKLWPYFGIGWRSLRNGEDSYTKWGDVWVFNYQRTSTYIYMPIGLKWEIAMGESVKLTLNGQFDWLLHGNQNSHTGDFFVNADSVSNTQNKGYGVRAAAKLSVNLGSMGLFVEPFWRYWKIQNSNKQWYDVYDSYGNYLGQGWMMEPFNITREYGIRAGIMF